MPLLYGMHTRWYIGNTDPASDPINAVRDGKGWVKTTSDNIPWGGILGIFLRDSGAWEPFPFGGGTSLSVSSIPSALRGDDGDDGWPGPPGQRGLDGTPGTIGRDGLSIPGQDGDDGDQGYPGRSGRDGLDGRDGRPGFDGQDGEDNYWPIPGPPGPSVASTSAYYVRARKTVAQSIPDAGASWTTLTWDDAPDNNVGMWTSAANTKITFLRSGFYLLGARVNFAAATGTYDLRFILNGATTIDVPAAQDYISGSSFQERVTLAFGRFFTAGDYIEVQAYQSSGSARNVTVDQEYGQFWACSTGGDIGPQGIPGGGVVLQDDYDYPWPQPAPVVVPGQSVLLFDQTLTVDTATIDTGAGGIPPGFNVLEIFIVGRIDEAVAIGDTHVRFNGDSGTNYIRQYVGAASTSVSGANDTASNTSFRLFAPGTSFLASVPVVARITIPCYAQTTFFKTIESTIELDSTTDGRAYIITGLWKSTAAINQIAISVVTAAKKFVAGSRMLIYGR